MDPAVTELVPPPQAEPAREQIHFAPKSESLEWHKSSKPDLLCWPLYQSLRFIALPAVLISLFVLTQMLAAPPWLRIILLLAISAAILTPLFVRQRRRRQIDRQYTPDYPLISDQRVRVRAAGPIWALRTLQAELAVVAHEFEPRVFRVGRRTGRSRTAWRDWTFLVVVFVAAFAALRLAADLFHIRLPLAGMLGAYAATALTVLTWGFCWPTYLRVVPGRLDLLEYPFLGRGSPHTRSFDLRTSKLLVLLPNAAVIFPRDSPRTVHLDAGPFLSDATPSLGLALLAAATSTAPTPPLPDNELLG